MTTREPGARLVLTVGRTVRPRSTARLASRPAATITEGFEVLVQLVMAAITIDPCSSATRGFTGTATALDPCRLGLPPSASKRATSAGSG